MIRADEELSDRFIPAGAGNSIQNWLLLGYTPVYPRWRGELACCLHIPQCARRFIPAGAGNSFMPLIKKVCNSVYPRWRGELHKKTNRNWLVFGLSPLARGTPLQTQFLTSPARFIPAGAGNSFFRIVASASLRFIPAGAGNSFRRVKGNGESPVYPRWRGELHNSRSPQKRDIGLSPLARGTLDTSPRGRGRARFIPAGAGNSLNITYY